MKKSAEILIAFLFLPFVLHAADSKSVLEYVNPIIGSAHSRWFFYTPAAVPFGMAKPAPCTDAHLGSKRGWQANGYDPRHGSIEGFANFHEFQVGGLVLMPMCGELKTVPGDLDNPDSGYRSRFDHSEEHASPGYYSVFLRDYGITAELTSTKRVAFHRYTFGKSGTSHLIFDVGNVQGESGPVTDAFVRLTGNGRIEGWISTYPYYVQKYQAGAEVRMYFSAEIDKVPLGFGTFNGKDVRPGTQEGSGIGCGMYLTFDVRADEKVNVKIGLSYTSIENARLNLTEEASRKDFCCAKKEAETVWTESLEKIKVYGSKEEDKVKFYTGLYHALLGRGLASDVNGAYPAHDGSIGQIELDGNGKPIHNHYNTDAIWGGCWNLLQLWSLICPDYYADWIDSQLLVYKDSGWLGDGIACSRYVSGVGTNFTGMAIASAYNCGIRGFDVETGYEAALKNEIEWKDRPSGAGKIDLRNFVEKGYCAYAPEVLARDSSKFGSSHTLEYSFTSYGVAQFAKSLGKADDYERLMGQSHNWKNIYDPSLKMFHSRNVRGEYYEPYDTLSSQAGFQEGNTVQYSFYVPHAPEELVKMTGRDWFNERLDTILSQARENCFGGGTIVNAFAGLTFLYNHGNQPCLYIPWMFNFSGRPDLSQKWVRRICDEFYGTEPVHGYGYGQDEDQGQLGAWYVLSSIGLFDVRGLTSPNPAFQIGSPLFDKVVITLPGKKKFVIDMESDASLNQFVSGASFNGKELERLEIPFRTVTEGGRMRLHNEAAPWTE